MRKLEKQMNQAIRGQRNWAGSNTTVFSSDDGLVSRVYLHGNHIATYSHTDRSLTLLDGGWQSVTTKSRLNALCSEFAPGPGVMQKNWTWFLTDRFTGLKIPFISGMFVR